MHMNKLMHHFHVRHPPTDVEDSATQEILTLDMWSLFKKLAIPSMIGMFMYSVYMFVDLIFVGRWVGSEALAAVSIVFPLVLVNLVIASFIGMGAASLLSRSMGKKKGEPVPGILSGTTLFAVLFSVVYTVLGVTFANQIVGFMGASGEILAFGTSYFEIIILGAFFFNFVAISTMLIQAEGRPMAAMVVVTLGSSLNMVLDIVFIYGLGMGVEGAAIATVIAMMVTALIALAYYLFWGSVLSFDMEGLRSAPRLMKEIAPVGSSGAALSILAMVEQILIFKSVGLYGGETDFILIGATLNMLGFAAIPLSGIAQGLAPLIGMNFGANKKDRVMEGYKKFLIASTGIAGVIWIVFMLFPDKVLSIYIADPAVASSGSSMFRVVMGAFALRGFIILPPVLFQSIGKGTTAFLLLLSDSVLLFAPVIIAVPYFIGIDGVWLAILLGDILILVMGTFHVFRESRTMERNKADPSGETEGPKVE
jgi:putative MATE family efflux protein